MGGVAASVVAVCGAISAIRDTFRSVSTAEPPSHAPSAPINDTNLEAEMQAHHQLQVAKLEQEKVAMQQQLAHEKQEMQQSYERRAEEHREQLRKMKEQGELDAQMYREQLNKKKQAEQDKLQKQKSKLEEQFAQRQEAAELKLRKQVLKELKDKRKKALREYPMPKHIDTAKLNFGFIGMSGVGKSSLINALLGKKATDHGAAKVDVNECTRKPTPYTFSDKKLSHVLLWDLPGAGTSAHPAFGYVKEVGLRYYDAVLIVTASRFTEMDLQVMQLLQEHGVPYYMVRNKLDVDIRSNQVNCKKDSEATIRTLRQFYKKQGIDIFLVSAMPGSSKLGDWTKLQSKIGQDLLTHRKVAEGSGVKGATRKRKVPSL